MPGAMPTLNKNAVELAVKAGLALNCKINEKSRFVRKNYCYPDLPKAFQITQTDLPLCYDGALEYVCDGEKKRVRINRIQLEEDAGKLVHDGEISKIDYNRCGVPLIEIVTEPDLSSPEEAVAFLTELKSVLRYSGVSKVKMQEGNLRFDVNISVSKSEERGTRTETKNLNSFKSVLSACSYEINRQIVELEKGSKIELETRRFDENLGEGFSMREKETAEDYRFFIEPDLLPLVITNEEVEKIKHTLPVLRAQRVEKYIDEFYLDKSDAYRITDSVELSNLFDETVALGANPKATANIILGEITRLSKVDGANELEPKITSTQLYEALLLVSSGEISITAMQQKLLPLLWGSESVNPKAVASEKGLIQISNYDEIEKIVLGVINENQSVVSEYKNGNERVFPYLVGLVMKASKGRANPKLVNEILIKKLDGRS
jgi:aspartyl-tRNA(Asn)/glutamyl-tRNA(Gln) amidotransferase subunit B